MDINFSEMFATMGSTLFYGGIIGVVLSVLLGVILLPIFASEKKRINKRIDAEYNKKD